MCVCARAHTHTFRQTIYPTSTDATLPSRTRSIASLPCRLYAHTAKNHNFLSNTSKTKFLKSACVTRSPARASAKPTTQAHNYARVHAPRRPYRTRRSNLRRTVSGELARATFPVPLLIVKRTGSGPVIQRPTPALAGPKLRDGPIANSHLGNSGAMGGAPSAAAAPAAAPAASLCRSTSMTCARYAGTALRASGTLW